MRVLFLGTPAFAVPTLIHLLGSSHQVAGVITRPDRRRGRGGRPSPSPVRRAVLDRDIPVLQPERVNTRTVYEQVVELGPDVAVVVAFGSLLSTKLLEIPRLGCINLHASLLPRYRGAAPIQWSVARGDAETGLTTMQMDAGMDTGDILLQRIVPIDPEETAAELAERLAALGGPLILETLDGLEAGSLKPRPQPAEGACRAPLLRKEDGRVDWTRGAGEIVNLVRGMQPWPVAHTLLGDIPVRLFRAAMAPAAGNDSEPGVVRGLEGEALLIDCGDGQVAVRELQLPNRRRMTGREAVNGRALRPGDRLL